MVSKENVILIPGTIRDVKGYGSYNGLDIWMNDNKELPVNVTYFIGHSLGVSYILNLNVGNKHKFIFINPLVKKRNALNLFVRWIKFLIFEGINREKIIPIKYWIHMFKQVLSLLRVDVLGKMKKIPRGDVVVIRGKNDRFFCDEEDVEIMKKNNFKIIEIEAGHDWNRNVEGVDETIEKLIQNDLKITRLLHS